LIDVPDYRGERRDCPFSLVLSKRGINLLHWNN